MAKVNIEELDKRVAEGLLTKVKHPHDDLWIYNYTPVAQYQKDWDEYTIMARGLIVKEDGEIWARPFPKFFNLEEHKGSIPNESFKVHEKMDGSLGILYWSGGIPYIATRGSFSSDQAHEGTALLHDMIEIDTSNRHSREGGRVVDVYPEVTDRQTRQKLYPNLTYLFEIIYPENRIVVDYGKERKLVLLAVINTETGEELDIEDAGLSCETAKQYDGIQDIASLRAAKDNQGREGYVIRFASGLRLKFKFDEYVRLHRILTQTSTKVVWEVVAVEDMARRFPTFTAKQIGDAVLHIDARKIQAIMDKKGKGIESMLERVPDEFYSWLHEQIDILNSKVHEIVNKAELTEFAADNSRLKVVELTKDNKLNRAVTFALMDGKKHTAYGLAWRYAEPAFSKPFANDIDA